MMLGFMSRFENKVKSGEKRHTIRAVSKRNWRPGVMCDCYVNPRQKTMRLLGRWPCTKVETIRIDCFGIALDGMRLTLEECECLARADGFSSHADMMGFWWGRLPFNGIVIHWDYSRKIQTGKGGAAA